jgi:hypothetical protein
MRRMKMYTQARDVGYVQPGKVSAPLKSVTAAPMAPRHVDTMPTVFRGPVRLYHDDKASAFKIDLRFGETDLDQIVDARKAEFDRWVEEQRAFAAKRAALKASRLVTMEG